MSNKHTEISASQGSGTLNVGYGNFVLRSQIIAILEAGSLPMRRLRERAAEENLLVDATAGRKMRSVIVTASRYVILSALAPQTLQERLSGEVERLSPALLELEAGEFVS